MGFFDYFRREKRSTEGAVTLEQLLGGNETLTVKIAMQVPAVAYCVEMIASAAAMLPVKLYIRKSDGETEEITDDPRITLLNGQTGDTMNADNMRRVWVRDFLLTGSAFAYIETRYGMPCALKYIPSGAVGVMSSDTDYIHKHFSYIVTGKEIFPHQMLKILRNSDGFGRGRGIVGESPLIMDTMYQLLKFQKNQVLKGGNKRGFLKSDAPVRKEVKDDIEEKWRQLNSNDDSAERIMFLNGNIDFKEMSSTAVEMQLNENVQTNDAEIMRLFGTADGILSPETVKNAVMPVLDVFEAAFDSDLLLESEKADHYFAFDTKELTRGDISTRYNAYATALQNNFMQLDEVRALEDLPPLGFNYITLGLQNVLVNPATGEVYTPNTNASANMNRLGDIGGNGEDRAEPIQGEGGYLQDPSTGRMMGRVGSGGSANVSGNGVDKAGEKDYNNYADYYEYISASGPNEFDCGFSPDNLLEHWYGSETVHSHKAEYEKRGMNMKQYGERALELVQMPTSKTILGYKDKDGCVIRYDTVTKDFVKGHPKKGIKTMFEAELSYYERQKHKDLEE